MNIEQEARFYFPHTEKDMLIERITARWNYSHSFHEVTTMYDNPNPALTFYSKKIDGRLRLRYSKYVEDKKLGPAKNRESAACLVTWKRRLVNQKGDGIRREEEIEYSTNPDEADRVRAIFEDVIECPRVSSYERIRHFFDGENVQVTLDEFPFGLMLEFELKNSEDDSILNRAVEEIRLDMNETSPLSCDDMYHALCEENKVEARPNIEFSDDSMPTI